jgi:hypothetical protein
MARYYNYEALGKGIRKIGSSTPLITGTQIHECLAKLMIETRDFGGAIPYEGFVRNVIKDSQDIYKKTIAKEGFLEIGVDAEIPPAFILQGEEAILLQEQCNLIEGLVWGWYLHVLQAITSEFEIVSVEQEELYEILDGPYKIIQMSRPDFVLRSRVTKKLVLGDFKSTAQLNDEWVREWASSIQMAVGTLGVEARLKEPVEQFYIHALVKGGRKSDYNTATKAYDGPRRQQSLFCYGYTQEGNMPFLEASWRPSFKYVDNAGKNRTLGPGWNKVPTHLYPGGVEAWVKSLPKDLLMKQFAIIGPYQRQDHQIKQYLRSMVAEEVRNQSKLDCLPEGLPWTSEEFQGQLDKAFPRSYNCFEYGSRCQFYELCFRHPGWDKPLENGYIQREANHQLEKESR